MPRLQPPIPEATRGRSRLWKSYEDPVWQRPPLTVRCSSASGVCSPSTWTPEDHRGLLRVAINSGSFTDGKAVIEEIAEIDVPRREEWLGQ